MTSPLSSGEAARPLAIATIQDCAFWIAARVHNGLSRLDFVFNETVGLITYRVSEHSDAPRPGPTSRRL